MAQDVKGRRDVVQDPLRQSAQQVLPERSLPVQGVRGPASPSMAGFSQQRSELDQAMGALEGVVNEAFDRKKDDWITEGKVAYMSGVAEEQLLKNGNRYTQMGYLQLKTRNDVNNWYLSNQADLANASASMSPDEYQKYLSDSRKSYLDTISDPYAKKVAVAAFEQFSPDLAGKQFVANNDYNLEQRENEAYEFFMTGSTASPTRSQVDPNTSLKLSPTPVGAVVQSTAMDRDAGIKTLIGEAGNQGDTGMAAVAHVFKNRLTDSRYPNSIYGVVKAKNQFSVWNPGKEGRAGYLNSLKPGNPIYDKAAKIYDAVMSGRHIDPTGGAVNYYSPSGMQAYKKQGIQSHTVPSWASKAENENLVVIGAHRFSGKSNAETSAPRPAVDRSNLPRIDETDEEFAARQKAEGQVNERVSAAHSLFDGPANTADTTAGVGVEALNAAPAEEGVSGIEEAGAPNEIMDFIKNYKGLPQDRLVAQLTRAMATQLDAGEDTLFNDAGGVAALYELGATPKQIDAVSKARQRWQNEQDKKFDADDIAFEDDIMRLAGDGKTSREDIFEMIEDKIKAGAITDQYGRSLASKAATAIRTEDRKNDAQRDSIFADTGFLQEIGGLYQQIQGNSIDFADAAETAKEIAGRYGADAKDVETLLGRVFALDQQRQNSLRTRAEAEVRKAETSNALRVEAERALARGYGLGDVSGTVTVTDEAGNKVKMTAQEYAITQLKARAFAKHGEDVNAVALDVFTQLQKHGVVDKQTSAQFQAAVAGQIVGKDGKVNPDAEQAYDLYTLLRENPIIRDDFVSDLVGDEYTRNVLELAYRLDSGNQTGSQALVRAQDIIQNGGDLNARLPSTPQVNIAAQEATRSLIEDELGITWYDRMFGQDGEIRSRQWAAQDYSNQITSQIKSAADLYMVQYPWQKPEVALELAKQDVRKNMQLVAGNLVFSKDKLHKRMGLTDPSNVDAAMRQYILQYGRELWPDIDDSFFADKPEEQGYMPWLNDKVRIRYMPNAGPSGAFRISHVIDRETGQVDTAREHVIPLSAIGGNFNRNKATPNLFERMFDAGSDAVGAGRRALQEDQRQINTAAELGTAAGSTPVTPSSRVDDAFSAF